MPQQPATNRDRALSAALQIVGQQGIRALTHGRVDSAAGLPAGSTSNYFRTRSALVHGTVEHLVTLEQGLFTADKAAASQADLVDALVRFVDIATGAQRELTVARFVFFTEGFHDPHVCESLNKARARVESWAASYVEELGILRPFASARRILTYLDGAILHKLTFDRTPDLRADLAAIIDSCTAPPSS